MSAEVALGVAKLGASLIPAKNNVAKNTGKAIRASARYAIEAQNEFGVNALELIRSGAGSAGGQQSQPRIASMAALTDSFDQISDVLTGREAQRDARQDVQDELAKVELETRRAELERYGQKVPRAISAGLASKPVGVGTPTSNVVGTPTSNVPAPEAGRQTVTSANVSHKGAWVDPHTPDAETGETRYGDIAQEAVGIRNIVNDTLFNSKMERIVKAHGRDFAQKVYDAYAADRESDLKSVYRRLMPEGKALNNRLLNPDEYEKPTMREKPRAGWATENLGNFNLKE